ncbi:MAG: transglutaminase domain-containing protein [Deltaproteobacteria bacterium]|nr:transglutaminase domain-containing protein [Deltaproteobacteria bacterium]
MSRSGWAVLAVLVVAATYGLVGPSPYVAAALAVAALAALVRRGGQRPGPVVEAAVTLLVFAFVLVLLGTLLPVRQVGPPRALRLGWATFAGACLAVAALRLHWQAPRGGALGTLGAALAALAACGGMDSGPVYPVAVGLFLGAALAARRYADPGRAPLGVLTRRTAAAAAVLAGVAAVATAGAASAIPPLHGRLVRAILMRALPVTGFSDRLWLGSLGGMLLSDTVVLRVRGKSAELLRGTVYTRYRSGCWSRAAADAVHPVRVPRAPPPLEPWTEIEILGSDPDYYFLPLGAADVAVETGLAQIDRAAVLGPVAAEPAGRIWFRPGARPRFALDAPDAGDLDLPPALRVMLAGLARSWAGAEPGARAQLDAIAERLRTEYRYSLSFFRPKHREPVEDFLLQEKTGHCEYFASAMALLARALGIPARVVAGYRVTEHNALGGYFIVRERDAHAWVEAWVDGAWQSFDPTPPDPAGPRGETPLPGAVLDLLRAWWRQLFDWLAGRSPAELLSGPAALLVVGLLVRRLRRWRRGRQRERAGEDALPSFRELGTALGRIGLCRTSSEPVEHFAARLEGEERLGPLGGPVAAALVRYAAFRYGGVGERGAIERQLSGLVGQLGAVRRRPRGS